MKRRPVMITWQPRKKRYIARLRGYPVEVIAYGTTIKEAQENIKLAFQKVVRDRGEIEHESMD